ncbi:LPS translocon maturation chaperone LptM [Polaromonas sp.]|uniref:LPS translocon maturation chaperone LptM n=1 Tax=Polaromonas sp. TaxID=1869339 RepID=UPI001A3585C7|nr:lipoprotein [Burkholderiales bacterium]
MVFSPRILGRLYAVVCRHGFVAAVAGAAALSGCGQKGPLFLPVPPQAPPPLMQSPSLLQAPPAMSEPIPPASAAR